MAREEPEAKERHNRASAELSRLADYVDRQDEAHPSLNELQALEEASDERLGSPAGWRPTSDQAEAIRLYSLDDTQRHPDELLRELVEG